MQQQKCCMKRTCRIGTHLSAALQQALLSEAIKYKTSLRLRAAAGMSRIALGEVNVGERGRKYSLGCGHVHVSDKAPSASKIRWHQPLPCLERAKQPTEQRY